MENARIRHAEVRDAAHVARLMTELGYPTTIEAMTERLAMILTDPSYATFVTDTDTGVIGVAGARLGRYYENDGMYSQLLVLAVSSTARGRGTGTRLVEAVERWAAAHSARTIVVNSALHRADAHGFYEGRHYVRTGYRFVKQLTDAALAHGRPV